MSALLKPGTICVTIGGSGENAGLIVRVVCFTGAHSQDSAITEGYRIETASGRPFASVREYAPDGSVTIILTTTCHCIADRRRLRPLVTLAEDAGVRDTALAFEER